MDPENALIVRDDAPWKKMQEIIFTRWANEQLKSVNKSINSLETDLSDGTLLIALIEVLSGQVLSKYHSNPTLRSQKLENVSLALEFLERVEGITVVNIDSSDIVDGNLKLILGLLWHLILYYSISKANWEEDDIQNGYFTKQSCWSTNEAYSAAKERLLSWIQKRVPLPISNFTTDWNDGRALGALIDAMSPGLCPQWSQWNSKHSFINCQDALGLAEKYLGIPQLIRPEELTDPEIDERSVMTYLSQFRHVNRNRILPSRVKNAGKASKMANGQKYLTCKAFGRGLQFGIANQTNLFKIDTRGAGPGTLNLGIEGPGESQMRCIDNRDGTWTVEYKPDEVGDYDVSIKMNGHPISGSPFKVKVNPSEVHAENGSDFASSCDCKQCLKRRGQTGTRNGKTKTHNAKGNAGKVQMPKVDPIQTQMTDRQDQQESIIIKETKTKNEETFTISFIGNMNSPESISKTTSNQTHTPKVEPLLSSDHGRISPDSFSNKSSKNSKIATYKTTIEIRNDDPKDFSAALAEIPKELKKFTENMAKEDYNYNDDMAIQKSDSPFVTRNPNPKCPCKDCQQNGNRKKLVAPSPACQDRQDNITCNRSRSRTPTPAPSLSSSARIVVGEDKVIRDRTSSSTVIITHRRNQDGCVCM